MILFPVGKKRPLTIASKVKIVDPASFSRSGFLRNKTATKEKFIGNLVIFDKI